MYLSRNNELKSTYSSEEVFKSIKSKSLEAKDNLNIWSTVNMIENDKDFYGYIDNDKLYLSRIRRLFVLRIIPKLIIAVYEKNNKCYFDVKLSIPSKIILFIFLILLIPNTYELFSTQRFTDDFKTILFTLFVIISLIWIEIKIYKSKLKKHY